VRRALADARAALGADETGGQRARTVIVACSGGPDSAALLGLVELLVRPLALRIVVGHVDHGLRAASADEAELVRATAIARGHDVRTTRLVLTPGPGIPARARDARRAALRAQATEVGAALVLLGHTATDQAETMLLHLCRGAGLAGLSAMAPCEPFDRADPMKLSASPRRHGMQPGAWVRPLLHLHRHETRELAVRFGIPFVDDPTNLDPAHPRTAIREHVLPILRGINPRVEAHLGELARHARDAEQTIVDLARDRAPTLFEDREDGALAVATIRTAPAAVRTHVLRRFCLRAGVSPDALRGRTIAAIDAAVCEGDGPHRWHLHPHRTLWLEEGRLRIAHAGPVSDAVGPTADPSVATDDLPAGVPASPAHDGSHPSAEPSSPTDPAKSAAALAKASRSNH